MLIRIGFILLIVFLNETSFCQKINGEIFIPMNNRNEIWLKPRIDTLDNGKQYEFKIRVAPDLTISQFLFEKGLAVQNDSVLVIKANSTKFGQMDTATLRVIVNSISGGRIMLFQKSFLIRVPEKEFPLITNPKTNLIKLNDKVFLERNRPYPKQLFTDHQPFVALYDNEVNLNKFEVTGVTIALMQKEGKQYVSTGDTITMDALRELKKIRDPIPVFIKVDALHGKTRKSVWNRVIVYEE
jgi:hypothetical protein